ncbi:hypothetical protein J4731_22775 [Providencia rettgeri]|nr:hypothetical protein [Providencia rettgeri]
MSHEIRTHISAIIGLLELAATNKNQQDDITESIQIPYESALSLMGLIGDILDMAKIESGKLELVPEWVKSNELATPVVRLFEGLAKQKVFLYIIILMQSILMKYILTFFDYVRLFPIYLTTQLSLLQKELLKLSLIISPKP